MIKMMLCCGGGFSSSYVAQRMQKEICQENLENEVMIEFSPFTLMQERINEFDIILCCPHLYVYVKQLCQQEVLNKPLYVLPPRMYGKMEILEIYQDAKDIIEIFQQTHQNPVHFPGEENILRVTRLHSYRHMYQNKKHL